MRKAEQTQSLAALAAEANQPSTKDIRAGIHGLPNHGISQENGTHGRQHKHAPRTINPRVHNNSAATKGMLLRGKNR